MTGNDDLMRRLAGANPAPPDASLPLDTTPADVMTVLEERLRPTASAVPSPVARRWRGPAYAVAVFLAILAAGFALRLAIPGTSPTATAPLPIATSTPPTPTAPPSTAPPTTVPSTTAPDTTAPTTTQAVPGGVDVRFETEIVPVLDEWPGPFTASGRAVDEGIMCAAGERSLMGKDFGIGSWRNTVIFTCDDGSGSFELSYELTVAYGAEGYTESGTWRVTWGDGAYEHLTGWGTDHTTMPEPNHFASVGIGRLAIDGD